MTFLSAAALIAAVTLLLGGSVATVEGLHLWTGLAQNDKWSDAWNWLPLSVPNASSSVLIACNQSTINVIGDVTINVASVTLSALACDREQQTVTLQANNGFSGQITVTDGGTSFMTACSTKNSLTSLQGAGSVSLCGEVNMSRVGSSTPNGLYGLSIMLRGEEQKRLLCSGVPTPYPAGCFIGLDGLYVADGVHLAVKGNVSANVIDIGAATVTNIDDEPGTLMGLSNSPTSFRISPTSCTEAPFYLKMGLILHPSAGLSYGAEFDCRSNHRSPMINFTHPSAGINFRLVFNMMARKPWIFQGGTVIFSDTREYDLSSMEMAFVDTVRLVPPRVFLAYLPEIKPLDSAAALRLSNVLTGDKDAFESTIRVYGATSNVLTNRSDYHLLESSATALNISIFGGPDGGCAHVTKNGNSTTKCCWSGESYPCRIVASRRDTINVTLLGSE